MGPFKCPTCNTTTWGDLRHCPQCGTMLHVRCSGCGASWRYFWEYRHCPVCGMPPEKSFDYASAGRGPGEGSVSG